MKRSRVLAIALASLLVLSLASPIRAEDADDAEYDDEDPAFLVVRKSLADESPSAIGKPATVVLTIANQGETAATNVELDDSASLPEGVALAAGAQTTAVFKKVDAGASVEFSYDIVPSVGGKAVQLPRASVAYTASDGGKPVKRTGLSSSPVIYVETPLELAFRHALTAGSYATLGVVRSPEQWKSIAVILGFVGVVFGGSTVLGKGKEAAAAARRSKALAALESDKTK